MRKVILALAVSLDGYIARENGDVDWLAMEDLKEGADEANEFFASVDTILFGRKTYAKGLEMMGGADNADAQEKSRADENSAQESNRKSDESNDSANDSANGTSDSTNSAPNSETNNITGGEISDSGNAKIMNYVFTRTPRTSDDPQLEFVSGDVREFIENLKRQNGKNICLMGGGELAKTFFEENLIDEIVLGVQAVIIGRGIPLFLPHDRQTALELTDVKTRRSGTVQISYLVKR